MEGRTQTNPEEEKTEETNKKVFAIYRGFLSYLKENEVYKDFYEKIIENSKKPHKRNSKTSNRTANLFCINNQNQEESHKKEYNLGVGNASQKLRKKHALENLQEQGKYGSTHSVMYYHGYYLSFYVRLLPYDTEEKLKEYLNISDLSFLQTPLYEEHFKIGEEEAKKAQKYAEQVSNTRFSTKKRQRQEHIKEILSSIEKSLVDSDSEKKCLDDEEKRMKKAKKSDEKKFGTQIDNNAPDQRSSANSSLIDDIKFTSPLVALSMFAQRPSPTAEKSEDDENELKLLKEQDYPQLESMIKDRSLKNPEKLKKLVEEEIRKISANLQWNKSFVRDIKVLYPRARDNIDGLSPELFYIKIAQMTNNFQQIQTTRLELNYNLGKLKEICKQLDEYNPKPTI